MWSPTRRWHRRALPLTVARVGHNRFPSSNKWVTGQAPTHNQNQHSGARGWHRGVSSSNREVAQ